MVQLIQRKNDMPLYSWFSKAQQIYTKKRQDIDNKYRKCTIEHRYITNYTMWPIASVIQGEQITPATKYNKTTNEKT